MRFTFDAITSGIAPHVIVQASRPSVIINDVNTPIRKTDNVTYPNGYVEIDRDRQEVWGWNDERQE
jgi:hypothetical protein